MTQPGLDQVQIVNSVSVIIVNFRTKELTLDAARSALSEPETLEVVVVENGSGDDSAGWLSERLEGTKALVVASEKNLGFGGGNNLGVGAATAPFCFLLNSDALIRPGALCALAARLEDKTIGVVAPAVLLADGFELQPDAFGRFPTPARILSRAAARPIQSLEPDWVSGAAMMLRRNEFLEFGGFDENLFMYMEDVDLCKCYRDRGLRVVRELSAEVVHLGGGSKISSASQKAQFRKSTDYYLEKHGFNAPSRVAVKAVRALYARIKGL